MNFDFVLVAFATNALPPDAAVLNSTYKGLRFSPLTMSGPVYTVDRSVWRRGEFAPLERSASFCPDKATIGAAVDFAARQSCVLVFGLTEVTEYVPPGSSEVAIALEAVSAVVLPSGFEPLIELGYDVVDQWTGLSAIANVGYDSKAFERLPQQNLLSNKFGLFASQADARKFSDVAADIVSEHAPLVPLRIVARLT